MLSVYRVEYLGVLLQLDVLRLGAIKRQKLTQLNDIILHGLFSEFFR
jgi:hypothetical protein